MSSRAQSWNILSNGLWSTPMIKFGQPNMKKWALSRPYVTASTSPSVGAYLDSAGCVKWLPTKVILCPSLQQIGLRPGQVQCFWNSQKPMPVLAQSVVRHVGLAGSKMHTLSSVSLIITHLDSSNRSFRVLFHTNLEPGLISCLKGCMYEAMLKA